MNNFCKTDERFKKKKSNGHNNSNRVTATATKMRQIICIILFLCFVASFFTLCVIQWQDVFSFRSYSLVLSLCYNLNERTHFSFIRIHWCVLIWDTQERERERQKKCTEEKITCKITNWEKETRQQQQQQKKKTRSQLEPESH